jgi:catechol-2,3-dioxygenase
MKFSANRDVAFEVEDLESVKGFYSNVMGLKMWKVGMIFLYSMQVT